jgi:hypothetical protein
MTTERSEPSPAASSGTSESQGESPGKETLPEEKGLQERGLRSLLEAGPATGLGKHPSLEKTDVDLGKAVGGSASRREEESRAKARTPRDLEAAQFADALLLREQLGTKTRECAALARNVDELKLEIEALRNDFSTRANEHLLEIRTLHEMIQKGHGEEERLQNELNEVRQANKQLKSQNLSLQYHLNLWGLPVTAVEYSRRNDSGERVVLSESFFPALVPLMEGVDPVPIGLSGDLASLSFPDLLHFLSHSSSVGVLTVVTEGVVSKLYLGKGVLQLAGWNNRDPELSLAALLEESQLVSGEVLAELRDGAFDLELASQLVSEKFLAAPAMQAALKEHARVILGFLFQLKRGSFFFQQGQVLGKRDLQFRLPVTDVLLKTAAEMDERERVGKTSEAGG